jgi:hypothetical protein
MDNFTNADFNAYFGNMGRRASAGAPYTMGGRLPPGDPPDTGGASSSGRPPPPPPGGGAVFVEGWRGSRELERLLQLTREHRAAQRAQAQESFPPTYPMDEDDDLLVTHRPPPPGPPPGGAGQVVQSHDMIRAELSHVAAQVHELRNHAMMLEHQRMAEEHARAQEAEARRQANAAMFHQAHARAPVPFLAKVRPVIDMSMQPPVQEKRAGSEPPPVTKRQIVERVVERPADAAAAESRRATEQIIAAASSAGPLPPITYEPPKGEVMPYTQAHPEIQKAVRNVVAAVAKKRASDEGAKAILDATIANDESGGRPKKTRFTTMARFNTAAVARRREQKSRDRAMRRVARYVVEDAAARAALKAPAPEKPEKPAKPAKPARVPKVRPDRGIVKMTPGRRAVAV